MITLAALHLQVIHGDWHKDIRDSQKTKKWSPATVPNPLTIDMSSYISEKQFLGGVWKKKNESEYEISVTQVWRVLSGKGYTAADGMMNYIDYIKGFNVYPDVSSDNLDDSSDGDGQKNKKQSYRSLDSAREACSTFVDVKNQPKSEEDWLYHVEYSFYPKDATYPNQAKNHAQLFRTTAGVYGVEPDPQGVFDCFDHYLTNMMKTELLEKLAHSLTHSNGHDLNSLESPTELYIGDKNAEPFDASNAMHWKVTLANSLYFPNCPVKWFDIATGPDVKGLLQCCNHYLTTSIIAAVLELAGREDEVTVVAEVEEVEEVVEEEEEFEMNYLILSSS